MPHFDDNGNEQWVCQKSGHICTGQSHWVERGSELAKELGCFGNVCHRCFVKPTPQPKSSEGPLSLHEHCRIESGGLTGAALDRYVSRHYGQN